MRTTMKKREKKQQQQRTKMRMTKRKLFGCIILNLNFLIIKLLDTNVNKREIIFSRLLQISIVFPWILSIVVHNNLSIDNNANFQFSSSHLPSIKIGKRKKKTQQYNKIDDNQGSCNVEEAPKGQNEYKR